MLRGSDIRRIYRCDNFFLQKVLQILLINTKLQITLILIRIRAMYVCLCKAVTSQQIEDAVVQGDSYAQIRQKYGVGTDCGCCGQSAKQLIRQTVANLPVCEFSEAS